MNHDGSPTEGKGGSDVRTAAEAGWHVSRYNLQARLPDSKYVVVFNTRTRVCVRCTPLEMYVMQALDVMPVDNPFVKRLAEFGFIANFDEREAVEMQSRLRCATAREGEVAVTICPTMACNFECPYCFANIGRRKMDASVQDDVVGLVGRMIDAAHASKLTITWFGGEPLLACDVIESLSGRLTALADQRGCAYEAWVFTNGYLITPEVVEMFVRCRIGHVHIPFDGLRETHDATRNLVGGGPTYERLMDNLGLIRPPIRTLVRANTHAGNVMQLDDLKKAVLARAKDAGTLVSFYAADLIDVSPRDEPNSQMAAYAYRGIEVSLRPESRHIPVVKDHSCVAQNLWMVAVEDAGYLYKCGGKLCGQPEFAYATARDWDPADPIATASNPDMLSRFMNTCVPLPGDKCYECEWLPLCGGGCPQLRLFGRHECPPYRTDPEAFVLAMHACTKTELSFRARSAS